MRRHIELQGVHHGKLALISKDVVDLVRNSVARCSTPEIDVNMKANLTSNVFVILSFLKLIRQGTEKKIIYISSNSGDVEFNRLTGIPAVLGYGAAKAGMNLIMSKLAADLAPEGITALSMGPGWVDTDAGQ